MTLVTVNMGPAYGTWLVEEDARAGIRGSPTLTAHVPPRPAGQHIRVESDKGVRWYGVVNDDGTALLIRQDLMPS